MQNWYIFCGHPPTIKQRQFMQVHGGGGVVLNKVVRQHAFTRTSVAADNVIKNKNIRKAANIFSSFYITDFRLGGMGERAAQHGCDWHLESGVGPPRTELPCSSSRNYPYLLPGSAYHQPRSPTNFRQLGLFSMYEVLSQFVTQHVYKTWKFARMTAGRIFLSVAQSNDIRQEPMSVVVLSDIFIKVSFLFGSASKKVPW